MVEAVSPPGTLALTHLDRDEAQVVWREAFVRLWEDLEVVHDSAKAYAEVVAETEMRVCCTLPFAPPLAATQLVCRARSCLNSICPLHHTMTTKTKLLLTCLLGSVFLGNVNAEALAAGAEGTNAAETEYLTFQLMTGIHGYAGPQPAAGHFALSKAQVEGFAHEVVKAIGTTGDARHKLGFTVGPLCFDMSDEETRQFIRDAFAVARENDVAVAFHIDDSICLGGTQGSLCPIRTTSRRRPGNKSQVPAGTRIGARSRPSSRPRCVSTARPSWLR